MAKHHKHNRKHQANVQTSKPTQHTQLHEVERYPRQSMQDYCLAWSIYLSDQGNEPESEIALLWADWVMTAPVHEFNTTCDAWKQWELSQSKQVAA